MVVCHASHSVIKALPDPVVVLEATLEYCIGVVGKYSLIIHMLSSLEECSSASVWGPAGVILGLLMGRYLLARAILIPFSDLYARFLRLPGFRFLLYGLALERRRKYS